MNRKIICFAPHPDDEILGCGGSLLKAKAKGYDITMVYLSLGEYASPIYSPKKLAMIRKAETKKVCHLLGTKNIYYLNIPDNQINALDFKSFCTLIKIIRKERAHIAYIPHQRETSSDHQQASLLIQRALGMAGSANFSKYGKPWWVGTVLGYEVWTPLEKYQYGEDISDFINKKIECLSLYTSQTSREGNVSDFISEKGKYLSGFRAAMCTGEFREVFEVVTTECLL